MEMHEILARIERRLEAVGLTESAASKLAGKPDAIRNLRRALEKDGRQGVSTATLNALAPVLGTTPVWLFAGAGPETVGEPGEENHALADGPNEIGDAVLVNARLARVIYAGVVEAGSFREVADFDDIEHEVIAYPADPDYPWVQQLQFEVRGDSMNALSPRPIMNGDRLIALDFEGLNGRVALHTGLIVVVQQSKDGGLLVERSVKQLEVYEDRYEFHPRSHNKKLKPIVTPHDMTAEDGKEVRILALVRSVMNRL
ncbi:S24 family peptidase [Methylobacterium sp. Leaf118]|uniref:S24 family peptidase n=1 Tax=Methylobacterium sp. Leaf118 TaxID=2876562 RepID=UPI001E282D99|nr:S24 family peptidase [Methylobacterium sp. Leaf118]